MRLIVVDPQILVLAVTEPKSPQAAVLALLAYGRVALNAAGFPRDELASCLDAMTAPGLVAPDEQVEMLRQQVEHDVEDAKARKQLMETALEQHAPSDLLLATSVPLLSELEELVEAARRHGAADLDPDRSRRVIVRHTWRFVAELEPPPFYLGPERVSDREYLIHTAVTAEGHYLITDDEDLQLPGKASHSDPKTRRTVRPYSFQDFVDEELPYNFDLSSVDAHPVLRAAVVPHTRAAI